MEFGDVVVEAGAEILIIFFAVWLGKASAFEPELLTGLILALGVIVAVGVKAQYRQKR